MDIRLPRLLVAELVIIASGVILFYAGHVVAQFGHIALILAFAVLLTYALLPAVNFLDRRRYIPRGLAIILVYMAMLATIAGLVALVSVPLAHQVEELAKEYPKYADQLKSAAPHLQEELSKRNINVDVQQEADRFTDNLEQTGVEVASKTGSILAAVFGTLSTLFFVMLVSVYFLHSGKHFSTSLISLFPKRRQRLVRRLATEYDQILGSFVRGHLLLALIIGVIVGVFCNIIGLPYSVLLAVVAGVTSLVPVIGAYLGSVGPLIVAAFVNPILMPVFIAFFIVLNEVSDKVLYPRIVGRAVRLHPLIVLFGVLAGVKLAGIAGALLATPILALTKVTLIALRNTSGYAKG